MPFTLSHPAAIFPLRRIPWLPIIPLIIGSMTPDLVEFLPHVLIQRLPRSHSSVGSVLLDLPFGLVLTALLVLLQTPLTAPLWEPHRSFVRAAIARFTAARWCWFAAAPAVVIGAWTHLLWDSGTHRTGWMVRHVSLLRRPLVPQGEHLWELFHFLQYASSLLGLVFVGGWYMVELRRSGLHGTGRIWRKCLLGTCVITSLGIGVLALSAELSYTPVSNYMMFSIVLERAMASFVLLYLAAGLAIAAVQSYKSNATRPVPHELERSG